MFRMIKLTVAYEGTEYVGWQRQRNGVSIQARLEEALERIEGQPVGVTAAGRTDAGVHALGQVVSVRLSHANDLPALARALNATLPADIRVVGVEMATADFDARRTARSKTYRYRIVTGGVISPFEYRYAWHVPHSLDCPAMLEAGSSLEGQHDFATFQATGSSVTTTVRTIHRFDLDHARSDRSLVDGLPGGENSFIVFDIEGDGFLRHMVRAIVGTLVEVGSGQRTVESVGRALRSGDRATAGPTAPARGLFLMRVDY